MELRSLSGINALEIQRVGEQGLVLPQEILNELPRSAEFFVRVSEEKRLKVG